MSLHYALPKRRKVNKMGLREVPLRVFPRHRRFVKSHECCVPNCDTGTPIEFAHVKTRGAGGEDWYGVSLCAIHHNEQHAKGVESFGKKYGIDLWALAAAFARRSPDAKMKEAMAA